MEFVARVLVQIPDPRRHLVRYYGAYSNAARGRHKKAAAPPEPSSPDQAPKDAAIPDGPHRAALRRRWAELIRRVYEVDPLVSRPPRPPPHSPQPLATPARDPLLRSTQALETGRGVGPGRVPMPSRSSRRSPP
jgi:hypothetical protein